MPNQGKNLSENNKENVFAYFLFSVGNFRSYLSYRAVLLLYEIAALVEGPEIAISGGQRCRLEGIRWTLWFHHQTGDHVK